MAKDENEDLKPVPIIGNGKDSLLSRAEFQQLAKVPAEIEWFGNINNPRTRRAYMLDLRDFMDFFGIGETHSRHYGPSLPEAWKVSTRFNHHRRRFDCFSW